MKKLVLFGAAIAMSTIGFAQASLNSNGAKAPKTLGNERTQTGSSRMSLGASQSTAKTTGVTDSFFYYSDVFMEQLFDSAVYFTVGTAQPADSGAFFGSNVYNMNAFAEWFTPGTYGTDTTMEIVGAVSFWGGTVQPGSTKSITFKMWDINTTTATQNDSDNYVIETPGATTYSQSVNIANLLLDTAATFTWFTSAQPVTGAFFLGYELNYPFSNLNGDTIGLYTTRDGYTWNNGYYDTMQNTNNDIDTLWFAQTCYRIDTVWNDVYASGALDVHLSIVPIYRLEGDNVFPASVKGITKNGLSFYGNYPNPAVNSTNIRIALDKTADVNVTVYDMTGRTVATSKQGKLTNGEHTIPVSTANLSAGNYVYMVTTSTGGAIAAQFTVTK